MILPYTKSFILSKLEPIIPDEELVRLLKTIQKEMEDDPRVKAASITDERYYHWRNPHYLRKFRILRDNDKL